MTKKFMIWVFVVLFLLLINLVFATERSSTGVTIARVSVAPSNCDYLKKYEASTSLGLRANIFIENPNTTIIRRNLCSGRHCQLLCGWVFVRGGDCYPDPCPHLRCFCACDGIP